MYKKILMSVTAAAMALSVTPAFAEEEPSICMNLGYLMDVDWDNGVYRYDPVTESHERNNAELNRFGCSGVKIIKRDYNWETGEEFYRDPFLPGKIILEDVYSE